MKKLNSGSIVLLVIIFGGIFFTLLVALSGFVLSQNRVQEVTRTRAEAFTIAEAGIEYYRWYLYHFWTDISAGTLNPNSHSVVTYSDPEGGTLGTYTLDVAGSSSCGVMQYLTATSTGNPSDGNGTSATIVARYAPPSVAQYSYIVGSSVWAGADRIIKGPYHSNGGIRMDGTPNAPVTSSVTNWDCTTSLGCTPRQASAPGVVGTGANQHFWSYPTPQLDFAAIRADFSARKASAQATGIYLPRYSDATNPKRGYHLIFNADGTVTVKKVDTVALVTVVPANPSDAAPGQTTVRDNTVITAEVAFQTYTIPSSCGLIYVEDNTWIEGVITGKVTLVAANASDQSIVTDAILKGNITYATSDGSSGLTVISGRNVLIAGNSPTNMTISGTFVAQSGAFGRNYYGLAGTCNASYEPRGTLTIIGTTVSNLRTGTSWGGGCNWGTSDAGYTTRIDAFDRLNSINPPPFTPTLSPIWQIVDWKQL